MILLNQTPQMNADFSHLAVMKLGIEQNGAAFTRLGASIDATLATLRQEDSYDPLQQTPEAIERMLFRMLPQLSAHLQQFEQDLSTASVERTSVEAKTADLAILALAHAFRVNSAALITELLPVLRRTISAQGDSETFLPPAAADQALLVAMFIRFGRSLPNSDVYIRLGLSLAANPDAFAALLAEAFPDKKPLDVAAIQRGLADLQRSVPNLQSELESSLRKPVGEINHSFLMAFLAHPVTKAVNLVLFLASITLLGLAAAAVLFVPFAPAVALAGVGLFAGGALIAGSRRAPKAVDEPAISQLAAV